MRLEQSRIGEGITNPVDKSYGGEPGPESESLDAQGILGFDPELPNPLSDDPWNDRADR